MSYSNQISSMSSHDQTQVVVVVVPLPAQGHLNQLLHLSHLILSHNIPVHYVGTATHNRQAILRVQGWDPTYSTSNINFHDFKLPPFPSPPPNPYGETKYPSHLISSFEASSHLRQPVASLLRSLSSVARKVIVIYDSLMASVVQDVTSIANAENYIFHSISAFTSFSFHKELGIIPSSSENETSLIFPELPSLEGCFPTRMMNFIAAQIEFQKFNDGSIYNTTRVIEGPYMELMECISGKKTWALGPFNPLSSKGGSHFSLKWLDKQEDKSVIYVSFGSTTAMTGEQINEIAIGLEQSKKKFIWVIRDADKGDIFDGDGVRRHELPNGFEERVEGMGLVVRDWAPQLEILSHPSTGGFMSHCGWNSCIEGITFGVPMVAWPMHSDQPRNSVLITQVLKVGLAMKDWAQRDELVTASDVESAVRTLMETKEGEEMRQKAMKLKDAIHRSMGEGGISRVEVDSFIGHITR